MRYAVSELGVRPRSADDRFRGEHMRRTVAAECFCHGPVGKALLEPEIDERLERVILRHEIAFLLIGEQLGKQAAQPGFLTGLERNLDGIRTMAKLPGALVVIDVHRERNAVREAKKLGIPSICLIDTDSDPDFADVPIPGNDDAIRAIEVVLTHLGDAVEEGKRGRTEPRPEEEIPAPKKRSSRPVTARAEEETPQATAGGPVPSAGPREVETSEPDRSEPPADVGDAGVTSAATSEPEGTA